MKLKVGLMLGGGGAKGAYQLGVIRALEEAKLLKKVHSISGVSIGAINALLLMSKKNHKMMSDIWQILDSDNVFGTKGQSLFKEKKIYDFVPVAEKLTGQVDLKQIRKSKYQGYATASLIYDKASIVHQLKTDTMEKKVFHLNKIKDPYLATMASASIPVVFGPTVIEGKKYVDGGLIDNYPITPLIENGCNFILSVALDDWFNPYLYDDKDVNIINFTSSSAFEKSKFKDLLDVMNFKDSFKTEKEALGYLVGKTMIRKMVAEKYIKKFLGFVYFSKKPGFNVLELSKFDEMFIMRMKTHMRISLRKTIKEQKKENKKLKKKGNITDE